MEAVFGPLGGLRGASWGALGGLLGPLGASRGPLGARGARLGSLEALSGPSWGRLGRLLGRLGALLGRLGTPLGASWAVLGLCWGSLGPSWGGRGGLLGRLGALEVGKRENAKNLGKKTNEKQRFWHLGALSARLLELSWGLLGASWARLGGILGCLESVPSVMGPDLGHRGRLGGLWEPSRRPGAAMESRGSWPWASPGGLPEARSSHGESRQLAGAPSPCIPVYIYIHMYE